MICRKPFSTTGRKDKLVWAGNQCGKYSVADRHRLLARISAFLSIQISNSGSMFGSLYFLWGSFCSSGKYWLIHCYLVNSHKSPIAYWICLSCVMIMKNQRIMPLSLVNLPSLYGLPGPFQWELINFSAARLKGLELILVSNHTYKYRRSVSVHQIIYDYFLCDLGYQEQSGLWRS